MLAYTRPLTVALQGKECDLFKAHEMAQHLIKALKNERSEEKFHILWSKIMKVAATLNIQPAKKRTVARQKNRSNPLIEDMEAHYRIVYYFAFLDHVIDHLGTRFSADLKNARETSFPH